MSDRVDNTIYEAVVNDEGMYSLWPANRELPLGWRRAGKTGLKDEVVEWITEVWTDMLPRSLRDRMQQDPTLRGGG
jgi:MbtH protein